MQKDGFWIIVFHMANPEQLAKIKKEVKGWNEWRQQNKDVKPDLNGADLSGANLKEADLCGADLREADLCGVDLSKADLSGARLNHANLSGANLSGANLRGANLSGANLSAANLSGANLREVDLRGAHLNHADLSRANLREAKLSGANLSRANLREAHLNGADLREADFSRADLSGADLRDFSIENAIYTQDTIWPYEFDPSSYGAKLVGEASREPSAESDFTITFAPELSVEQIETALAALADYYRSCGGVGFRIDFELQTVSVGEPVYVKR